jgi:hypothetical protein
MRSGAGCCLPRACPVMEWIDYLAATGAAAAGLTTALVDFTLFLCFFTLGVVIFVSVVVLGVVASCLAAAKAEATIIERARTELIVVFMAVSFLF